VTQEEIDMKNDKLRRQIVGVALAIPLAVAAFIGCGGDSTQVIHPGAAGAAGATTGAAGSTTGAAGATTGAAGATGATDAGTSGLLISEEKPCVASLVAD
jgi:hypothetical protein